MKNYEKYFNANQDQWNQRVDIHVNSDFYDNDSFIEGRNTLKKPELECLGDVNGLDILHVQCHFGQDSISLARMGANVTATDISQTAIEKGKELNKICGTEVDFVQTNTYHISNVIEKQFDIIFMSYGVLCWLPDLEILGQVLNPRLKQGGKIIICEFHPTIYLFNFENQRIEYSYNNNGVIKEAVGETYTDGGQTIDKVEYFWQHSFEEIMSPFINCSLQLTKFKEHYASEYPAFSNMKKNEKGEFVFGDFPYPLPHVYSMVFTKNK